MNMDKTNNKTPQHYYVKVDVDGSVDYMDTHAFDKLDARRLIKHSGHRVIQVYTASEYWDQQYEPQEQEAI